MAATLLSLALALSFPPQPNDDRLVLPANVKGPVCEPLVLKAQTEGKTVRWVVMDAGPQLFPPELIKDPKTAVFFCTKPGKYRVLAYTAVEGEATPPAITWIEFGASPDPDPPPIPPPIPPIDPLLIKLQAAYLASTEPAAIKSKQKDLLNGLYAAMVIHAGDQEIRTTGELLADMKRTADKLILKDSLIEVRKVISAEISATLGTTATAALDASARPRAVDLFNRIARALDAIK